ncbi:MAG: pyridoxal-phosphate dependent enzyme [Pelagibacteraceae bacterium]|nr:pyridoxal-phosphate dependent enzyme [Pelagibacteraceae bacterium]MBT4952340.1 pyridoxal-phosphate dependent enzyme [Pelagibacteraceae bacterium]MBT5214297.1 pyridoxal-phosphate dependent enzyme [Pelagibacteraceae bacterium]MBT6198339.1 pyridoxal-phosphate dependent enzyme [Pelagibacteraceae bacterium]MBT6354114.1 pyridoxal-phosphate dependent enzyme [Pelagibacteraceae bacterium]
MIPTELSISSIETIYRKIKPYINKTPLKKAPKEIDQEFDTSIYFKFECFQKSGSFKARGAINNIISSTKKDLQGGITAVSAGNHAIATSYAAKIFNLKNKIFLYESANPYRISACKNYNANISFTNANIAFEEVKNAENKGYKFVHPFDGPETLQGSATLGLEIIHQLKDLNVKIDNILISVGGGGLISGVGSILKQHIPSVKIIGIEPIGAKGLTDSLNDNSPLTKVKINSIADSLSAPLHMPYSFSIAKQVIDRMINVSDKEMINSMIYAFNNLKLFLEPACVAGFAALKNYVKKEFKGQNTLILLCGSNIDYHSWNKLIYS